MSNEIQSAEQVERPVVKQDGPMGFLMDSDRFSHLWRVAKAFSESALVPAHFQKKPADCFIACQLAARLSVDPFMLMQHLYVVYGRPGLSGQLVAALLNASGKIRGPIRYRFSGTKGKDDYGCTAVVTDAFTGEEVAGPTIDWLMVVAEGWNKDKQLRDGKGTQRSKWNTMPDQMFRYRAASYLCRAHYPEVMMGLTTQEEIEDRVIDVETRLAEPDPPAASKADRLAGLLEQQVVTDEAGEILEPARDEQAEPDVEQSPGESEPALLEEYRQAIEASWKPKEVDGIAKAASEDGRLSTQAQETIAGWAAKRLGFLKKS